MYGDSGASGAWHILDLISKQRGWIDDNSTYFIIDEKIGLKVGHFREVPGQILDVAHISSGNLAADTIYTIVMSIGLGGSWVGLSQTLVWLLFSIVLEPVMNTKKRVQVEPSLGIL